VRTALYMATVVATRFNPVSLFTLLTQVVFKQIDHPGVPVLDILHVSHLLAQQALSVPVLTVSGSACPLGQRVLHPRWQAWGKSWPGLNKMSFCCGSARCPLTLVLKMILNFADDSQSRVRVPSPAGAGEGGSRVDRGIPPYPRLRGQASQDSPLFSMGDSTRGVRLRRMAGAWACHEPSIPEGRLEQSPLQPPRMGGRGLKDYFRSNGIRQRTRHYIPEVVIIAKAPKQIRNAYSPIVTVCSWGLQWKP